MNEWLINLKVNKFGESLPILLEHDRFELMEVLMETIKDFLEDRWEGTDKELYTELWCISNVDRVERKGRAQVSVQDQ